MKKTIIIISLIICGVSAQSQILISLVFGDKLNAPGVEFGLEGGINLSTVSNFESKKMLPTFGLGFYFDIRLKNRISLSTGVQVKSTYGFKDLTKSDLALFGINSNDTVYSIPGTFNLRLSYFYVPILIRYKFKNHIYVEGGTQAGLMYKSNIEYTANVDDQDLRIRNYNRDDINKIDVGAMIGLGYILEKGTGMTIGVKYYYGFIDVVKSVSGTKNSSLFVKVNIPIGRAKSARKAEEKLQQEK